jgi:hypothetical protein
LSNLIQVSAWVSSLRIPKQRSWQDPEDFEVNINFEDGEYICWRFKPTTNAPVSAEREIIGIRLAYRQKKLNIQKQQRLLCWLLAKLATFMNS